MTNKSTNPKDSLGVNKLPLSLVPTTAIAVESLALLEGASKYGRQNWRATEVRATVYIDAALRHLQAYYEGEDVDPLSKVSHLGHVRACMAILIDAEVIGMLTDDRSYKGNFYRDFIDDLTYKVEQIKNTNRDKEPKHFTIQDNT